MEVKGSQGHIYQLRPDVSNSSPRKMWGSSAQEQNLATVVQFVGFSVDLISKSHEAYRSGSTTDGLELEHVVKDLMDLNERLQTPNLVPADALGKDDQVPL